MSDSDSESAETPGRVGDRDSESCGVFESSTVALPVTVALAVTEPVSLRHTQAGSHWHGGATASGTGSVTRTAA